jgi:hypothetical protein
MVTSLALAWSAVSSQHRLIYSVPERDLVVPEFSIPKHWPRGYGLDSRWHTAAAIWGAYDPQSDVLYLYSEYCADADPAVHATAIRARAEWIPGLFDPAGNGRNRNDGVRLNQMYQALGLHLEHIDNSIESGIIEVSRRMQSGRLKVFPSLAKYLGELRPYRRDESGQVVTGRDNLQDAARCLVIGISRMVTETVGEAQDHEEFGSGRFSTFSGGSGGYGGWMR